MKPLLGPSPPKSAPMASSRSAQGVRVAWKAVKSRFGIWVVPSVVSGVYVTEGGRASSARPCGCLRLGVDADREAEHVGQLLGGFHDVVVVGLAMGGFGG